MPKLFFLLLFGFLTQVITSQEIGLRFGDMSDNRIGIDGTIPLKTGRIHSTLSFGDNVGFDALYDFVIGSIFRSPDLQYYAGVGINTLFASEFEIGVAGEVGIEYTFPRTPVCLGLDYRPSIILLEKMDFRWGNFGLNIRYVFSK